MTQTDTVRLRPASDADLAELSDLCFRSKAIWGYDAAFMEACRAELTLTPRDLLESRVQVAQDGAHIVGVAQVAVIDGTGTLEKLFVAPNTLRRGIGEALFKWAVETARNLGASCLDIGSDPDAAGFYRRMGARDAGFEPSGSIPGRQLPRLIFDLGKVT